MPSINPQIPPNKGTRTLNRGTLGSLGRVASWRALGGPVPPLGDLAPPKMGAEEASDDAPSVPSISKMRTLGLKNRELWGAVVFGL